MAPSPLVLSAHPTAWNAVSGSGERLKDPAFTSSSCHYCEQALQGWREAYHLNDDHSDGRPENIVSVCPLCHLPQHLNRSTIDDEALLIWLPEMTQRAVITLVRAAHLGLHGAGISPASNGVSPRRAPEAARSAFATLTALRGRSTRALEHLGTTSPRTLGAALLTLPPDSYSKRAARLAGIRLMPTGRLFAGSRDVYREMLQSWATTT
ncbi:MAG: HNH endonuclease [Janthinobacterium lividum]